MMKRGLARFWYVFTNRYFRKEAGPGEPLRFLCGSEEELQRVTTWTCHANPYCNIEEGVFYIAYTATMPKVPGSHFIDKWNCDPDYHMMDIVHRLCDLIFKYNEFTGSYWRRHYYSDNLSWWRRHLYYYDECGLEISYSPSPPSAHERAEALLSLSEWLDGKVSEQEKRELLQLPDDVEI